MRAEAATPLHLVLRDAGEYGQRGEGRVEFQDKAGRFVSKRRNPPPSSW